MNTKIIMILSALFLAIIGMGLTFFPQEINAGIGMGPNKYFTLIIQILGGLYFGFAMINWMAKGSIVGGIYNRPIVIGNFAHFFIGGIALVKALLADASLPSPVWILAGIYTLFAIVFGILFNRHPAAQA
ncbi:hypothetical protein [Mucilaginibacter sp. AK015]|uniref:hypothetical protein n=1 Tax=Mucilaginibacter sp. AK015 TaxID=2723072 RepID=UPI00161C5DFD|nr:hypothetical protein [Mucilaginibacter sp. AK015]MBB5396962.1 hypothetical protein [Mucilaginibacter sp. AK015]